MVKLSSTEYTTDGLKMVTRGKFFKIFFSPSNLLNAYLLPCDSLIPKADKWIKFFYKISLFVELVILSVIVAFLLFSFNYQIALLVYIGYQITFMFGSYLMRGETLILKKDRILTLVDMAKQFGYLVGLLLSYLFYKAIEYQFQIIDNQWFKNRIEIYILERYYIY